VIVEEDWRFPGIEEEVAFFLPLIFLSCYCCIQRLEKKEEEKRKII
jgi:hypothetical protein